MLIAFSVRIKNTDFKPDFSFQSWECFRRSLVRLTCADERDTDREIQTWRVYERSECAVLGLNFVPRGILGGRNFCPAYAGRNGFPLKRARGTQIEVSPICGSRRLYRICVPAPVLQRRYSARPHFCGVMARYPDPDGSCNFQGADMKNCRPVAQLQILSENKESRPAKDQRILS